MTHNRFRCSMRRRCRHSAIHPHRCSTWLDTPPHRVSSTWLNIQTDTNTQSFFRSSDTTYGRLFIEREWQRGIFRTRLSKFPDVVHNELLQWSDDHGWTQRELYCAQNFFEFDWCIAVSPIFTTSSIFRFIQILLFHFENSVVRVQRQIVSIPHRWCSAPLTMQFICTDSIVTITSECGRRAPLNVFLLSIVCHLEMRCEHKAVSNLYISSSFFPSVSID